MHGERASVRCDSSKQSGVRVACPFSVNGELPGKRNFAPRHAGSEMLVWNRVAELRSARGNSVRRRDLSSQALWSSGRAFESADVSLCCVCSSLFWCLVQGRTL